MADTYVQTVDLSPLIREVRALSSGLDTISRRVEAAGNKIDIVDAEVTDVVPAYEAGGASACSVLTDGKFFGGSLGDLRKARHLADLPLLRKDFIIDTYQLFQAKVMGADAVLLIAAALTREECRVLTDTAHGLNLEVLLEVHSEKELDYVDESTDMLGVNNRHLGTFHTDVENSVRLANQLRGLGPLLVSESGIARTDTVRQLRTAGFQGFLIGETFMRTKNPGDTLAHFIGGLS